MTKLNNKTSSEERDTPPPTSQGVMFTTILLLIGGLLLTSVMLLYYRPKHTDEGDAAISGLTRALEILKGKEAHTPELASKTKSPIEQSADEKQTGNKDSGFNLKDVFTRNSDGSLRWPRLILTGFGLPSSEDELGFALINGKHVIEGGSVNGVKLIKILEHGVLVEYKGETKTLIVEL